MIGVITLVDSVTDLAIERGERADFTAAHEAFVRALERDPRYALCG